MNDKNELRSRPNKFYLHRLVNLFPVHVPWPVRALLFVSIFFVISGFGIAFDSVNGTFPPELDLLRQLFIFSWFICVFLFILSVYLSNRFYTSIYSWIETRHFIADFDANNQLKRSLKRVFNIGFGPAPLIVASVIYVVRRFLILLMTPAPIEVHPWTGNYVYWYLGADFLYSFVVLLTFWSVILFSGILHYVAQAFPIKVHDIAGYKESFEELVKLANMNILSAALAAGVFFLGILYWTFSVGTMQYYLASILLLTIAGIGVAVISCLNLSGIQKGLEKTKKLKIAIIRSEMLPPDAMDLQISLHSQVSIWKIGPRVLDSLLLPLLVTELPILLQYAKDFFLELFGWVS